MQSPSEYQRHVFNTLAILGLSQTQIIRKRNGSFTLKTSSFARRIMYFLIRLNTFLKFTFLVLLSCGVFQDEFEFFEKMAITLWFLIMILMATSERIWYKKYPFFEILTAWWGIEERVYERLGRPEQFTKDIRSIAKSRVWFQGIVAFTGVMAVAIQYDAAPKYCVFAYSIIESNDAFTKWLFGTHEILFLAHAWLVYGSVIYLSSAIGAEFTYNIEAIGQVLETFVQNRHIKRTLGAHFQVSRKRFSSGLSLLSDNQIINGVKGIGISNKVKDKHFDVMTFIQEYRNIHTVVTQLNHFAGYNFLYMHACSYIQMISDVFQLIQILRMPEAKFEDVMFFAEDMLVCMYMLYRCFKSMAFLHPSSESFLACVRSIKAMPPSSLNRMDRLVLTKVLPTLRPIAFRLGPCTMKVGFVGQAMDVLLQYYICVALWK